MKQPVVGDVVHFHVQDHSAPRAAIITRVNPVHADDLGHPEVPSVNLTVFSDLPDQTPQWGILASYSEKPKAGCWTAKAEIEPEVKPEG